MIDWMIFKEKKITHYVNQMCSAQHTHSKIPLKYGIILGQSWDGRTTNSFVFHERQNCFILQSLKSEVLNLHKTFRIGEQKEIFKPDSYFFILLGWYIRRFISEFMFILSAEAELYFSLCISHFMEQVEC